MDANTAFDLEVKALPASRSGVRPVSTSSLRSGCDRPYRVDQANLLREQAGMQAGQAKPLAAAAVATT